MTLIIKELVVKGIVTNENSTTGDSIITEEQLTEYLEQMKKEIEMECIEKIEQKIVSKTIR
ncbi:MULTISPECIES: DUF5908 family protein [unclassified Saccharicrinis]|uniref:DUF5908 family protein n=1 Tax=unclassified Saccharicrinis TaxID=2646859 RepID=UPI003D32F3B6